MASQGWRKRNRETQETLAGESKEEEKEVALVHGSGFQRILVAMP